MAKTVAEMTANELKDMVEDLIEEKLIQMLGRKIGAGGSVERLRDQPLGRQLPQQENRAGASPGGSRPGQVDGLSSGRGWGG